MYFYKRNDTFYFSRSIPSDLQHHFKKRKIEVSLRTKSESKASKSAAVLSDRIERYWDSLRMEMIYSRELGMRVVPDGETTIISKSFSITEALALYHRLKGNGKTKLFFESSERSIRYLTDCLGHDDLAAIEISDAGRFRDYLFERGMSSSSVKRVFSSVRAVINLAIREQGLSINNAFSGTFIPDVGVKKQRLPIPNDVLAAVQEECRHLDDEPRWLVALISDTGMRLSEAAGLSKDDVYLDEGVPYVDIKPHPWRRLKTAGSQRKVPLVGISLWAAKQACAANNSPFLFSRYCDEKECHSNSASAALNKWLKQVAGPDYVIHSFRHSMRDRLRAVNCSSDMIDQIGGWSSGKIGEGYGEGYSLIRKWEWLRKID